MCDDGGVRFDLVMTPKGGSDMRLPARDGGGVRVLLA